MPVFGILCCEDTIVAALVGAKEPYLIAVPQIGHGTALHSSLHE